MPIWNCFLDEKHVLWLIIKILIWYLKRFKNIELLKIIEAKTQLKHLLHFNIILTKTINYLKHKKYENYLCITITY
jgi:hypothetical protein